MPNVVSESLFKKSNLIRFMEYSDPPLIFCFSFGKLRLSFINQLRSLMYKLYV